MQCLRTNLKTQSIQSSERHTCSGHNAQTNDYFTTLMIRLTDQMGIFPAVHIINKKEIEKVQADDTLD